MCVRVYARVHRFYVLSRNRLISEGGLPESSARPEIGGGEFPDLQKIQNSFLFQKWDVF